MILTLALLGEAYNYNVAEEGRIELNNVYRRIGEIREEQANKPKVGPLPGPSAVSFSHLAAKQKILGALLVIQKEIECLDREAAAAK
ncbi:hypothetical protein [Methylosinus sp. PW1]|uniref:hypothetical protein n=1 Tax=Methylosinus sp. PW1 TaxID=107636 RepID=UPI0012EC2C85|nr:hypothetical protein [Methylosinus sp. PW1]